MASSMSRQNEPNCTLWVATQAGKKGLSYPFGTTHCVRREKCPQKPNNKSFIDQACLVKMVSQTCQKNLANIQPSSPHTWSITHTYILPLMTSLSPSVKPCESDLYNPIWWHWFVLIEFQNCTQSQTLAVNLLTDIFHDYRISRPCW